MKKVLAVVLGVVLIAALTATSLLSLASVKLVNGTPQVLLGNTQSSSPNYSMAWLDNVVIRDDASAVLTARLVPLASYPYSRTYEEFIDDVQQYAEINDVNETTVGAAYDEVAQMLYYIVTALGMTDDLPVMESYLVDYGITLPSNPQPEDTAKVAIVYAALRYDAMQVLYNKQISLSKGISLDQAEIVILSELTGVFLPSNVDSMNGFAVQAVRANVEECGQLPISENPSNSEVFHWAKVLTAASNDYLVPLTPYPEATGAQKEYVDYAYYASIFNRIYDITLNPVRLAAAEASGEELAVPRLILMTMLDEKGVNYSNAMTTEDLFQLACENACFELEEEFYSDVFNYDLYVKSDCTRLWFTPFPLASQLGGDDNNLMIYLGNTEVAPAKTTYAALDPVRMTEPLDLTVIYNNGAPDVQRIIYHFNVIKTDETSDVELTGSNLSEDLQNLMQNIIPTDNEKVNAAINEVIQIAQENGIDLAQYDPQTVTTFAFTDENGLPIASIPDGGAVTNGNPLNGLGGLMIETYPEDETAVLTIPTGDDAAGRSVNDSVIARTASAIRENPQIIAAPTGILALGGLIGYFWNKKRKVEPETDDEAEAKKRSDEFPDLSD